MIVKTDGWFAALHRGMAGDLLTCGAHLNVAPLVDPGHPLLLVQAGQVPLVQLPQHAPHLNIQIIFRITKI